MNRLAAARPGVAIRGAGPRRARRASVARDCVKRAGLRGARRRIDHADLDAVAAPAAPRPARGQRRRTASGSTSHGRPRPSTRQLGERLRDGVRRLARRRPRRRPAAAQAASASRAKRETDLRNGPLPSALLAYFEAGAAPTGAAAPRTATRRGTLVLAQGDAAGDGGRARRVAARRPRRRPSRRLPPVRALARRRRRVPGQPAAQEPAAAGASACSARGITCYRALRRRPARVQPRRRRVRRVGARPGVRGAARDRPGQGQAAPRRGGRGHRRRRSQTPPQRVVLKERRRQRGRGAVRAPRRPEHATSRSARTTSPTSST